MLGISDRFSLVVVEHGFCIQDAKIHPENFIVIIVTIMWL